MSSRAARRSRGSRLFRSFIISAALVLTLGAGAKPTPTATPTLPPEDPAISAVARHEFVAWQAGVVDKNHYATAAQSSLTDDAISNMSKALSSYGALVHTVWLGHFPIVGGPPGVVGYTYRMECTNAPVFEQLMIGADGKIDSINFGKKPPG
jgi:hypothetical protein